MFWTFIVFFYLPQEKNLFDKSRLILGSAGDVSGIIDNNFRDSIICLAGNLVVFSEMLSIGNTTEKLVEMFFEFYNKNSRNRSN